MRKTLEILAVLLLALLLGAVLGSVANAEDLYVSESGGGSGSSCSSTESVTWFNTSSNWGSGTGKISAGDTVHLCGVISTPLSFQGSGTSGNPITLLFESGASMQQPEWVTAAITFNGQSYITVDGGGVGVIESTDAGTGEDHQGSSCFQPDNTGSNITIQNVTCGPLYVRTPDSDDDNAVGWGVSYPTGANTIIRNSTFHDAYYCIQTGGPDSNNLQVYGNTLYNCSTGIAAGDGGSGTTLTGEQFHDNAIYDGYVWDGCWDDCTLWFHNDGIHIWTSSGGEHDAPQVYNNHIYGNWGAHTTAFIFMEADVGPMPNPILYNNLLNNQDASDSPTNGLVEMKTNITGGLLYNNTLDCGAAGFNGIHWEGGSSSSALNDMFLNCSTAYANDDGTGTMTHDYTSYWNTPSQGDTHLVTSNPDLDSASGYQPSNSSPVATAGENLHSTFTTDIAGTARPSSGGWTMGAYQASLASISVTLNDASTYPADHLGVNLGSQDYYSSYLYANLLENNANFQPYQLAAIITPSAGTTTTFTDSDAFTSYASNQFQGGSYEDICHGSTYSGGVQTCLGGAGPSVYSIVPGTSGSIGCSGAITSNTAANGTTGAVFTVPSCSAAFAAQDTIIVRSPLTPGTNGTFNFDDFGWFPETSGTGAVTIDSTSGDLPSAPWTGIQVVELAAGTGAAGVGTYFDPNGHYWFNGSYTQSILAKAISGSPVITLSGARTGSDGANWSETVTPTSSWTTLSSTFTVSDAEGPSRAPDSDMQVNFSVSGGTALIASASLVSAADSGNGTTWLSSALSAIEDENPGTCRLWEGAPQNSTTLDNWITPELYRYPTQVNGGISTPIQVGLEDALQAAYTAGCTSFSFVTPITLDWTFSQEVAEFLNGPPETTEGAKRVAQGGPTGGVVYAPNIHESLTNWSTCYIGSCSGGGTPGGTGTPSSVNQTINNSSPSLDGKSMLITFTTSQNDTNVLWYNTSVSCDTCTTFSADFQAYPASATDVQALEYDIVSDVSSTGYEYTWGLEWDAAGGHWQIWNQLTGAWVNTSVTTPPNYGAWNHIQLADHRVSGDTSACSGEPCMYYDSFTLNGTTYALNTTEPAGPLPGGYDSATILQFQIDSTAVSGSTTLSEYLDEANLSVGGGGWSSKFDHINIDWGNEVWNSAAGNEHMPMYTCSSNECWNYLQLVIQWCGAARSSPYWAPNNNCGATMWTANYGGTNEVLASWDTNHYVQIGEDNEYGQFTVNDITGFDQWISAWTEAWANVFDTGAASGFYGANKCSGCVPVAVYEGDNNSTTAGNITQAATVGYPEGEGYGLADVLMPLLAIQEFGVQDNSFFTLYQNTTGISTTGGATSLQEWGGWTWPAAGGTVAQAVGYTRPMFLAMQAVNNCIGTGNTGYSASSSGVTDYSFSGYNGVNAQSSVPYVQFFAFKSGSTRCLIAVNTDPTNSYTFTVGGTNPPTGTVTQVTYTSTNVTDSNETGANVTLSTSTSTDPATISVPAHSLVTESWSTGEVSTPPAQVQGTQSLEGAAEIR